MPERVRQSSLRRASDGLPSLPGEQTTDRVFVATRSGARRLSDMTNDHEGELSDHELDEVSGGIIPTIVELPTGKAPASDKAETKLRFMDYTDDC
jgi:hypothetical protein